MNERVVIAEVDDPISIGGSFVEPKPLTCAGGCQNHRTFIAVFYTPIVLIFGGLVALATFPEIAEYAVPWIGEPVSQHVCPSVDPTSRSLTGNGLTSSCQYSGCSSVAGLNENCCEPREFLGESDTTTASNESNLTEELGKNSLEVTTGETPADALSSINANATTNKSH